MDHQELLPPWSVGFQTRGGLPLHVRPSPTEDAPKPTASRLRHACDDAEARDNGPPIAVKRERGVMTPPCTADMSLAIIARNLQPAGVSA